MVGFLSNVESTMRHVALLLILALAACNTGTDGVIPGEDAGDTGPGWDNYSDRSAPDLAGPDLVAPDTAPDVGWPDAFEDAVAPCDPGEGCFLDPCADNKDCLSGWCVQHMGEDVCTQPCTEECPPGWSCKQVGASDPDVVFICVSDLANLCRPCAVAGDCESLGGAQDVCVAYGPQAGAFCGGACEDDGDCPGGYSCADVETIDGLPTRQCVNDLGECPCTGSSVALVLWTPCAVENDVGICTGKRFCGEDGLTACDAPDAAAETCDGADDDCDGVVDEGTCDDANPCTADACLGAAGCEHVALDGDECLDGDPCTVMDHCVAGICAGQPVDCDDGDPCTDDSCGGLSGCLHVPNEKPCDDGDPCTLGDHCAAGACAAGDGVDCDDGDLCTTDTCDPDLGCLHQLNEDPCDDGDLCTTGDHCHLGSCISAGFLLCDDGNLCTDDSCDPLLGCQLSPNVAPCDDGDACTSGDVCLNGTCAGPVPLVCDDGDHCTTDSCDPAVGCSSDAITPCCGNGVTEGPGEECDDGNLASEDGCDGACQIEDGSCFEDWLVGTPCNGVNYGNGCVPSDTGYHFKGIFGAYACWWHHKNQAWNTSTSSNYYSLGQHFGVTPGVGVVSWCHDKSSTPTPTSYSSSYFSPSDVGAWGWCAESDPNSVGFVCIPHEGHPACN